MKTYVKEKKDNYLSNNTNNNNKLFSNTLNQKTLLLKHQQNTQMANQFKIYNIKSVQKNFNNTVRRPINKTTNNKNINTIKPISMIEYKNQNKLKSSGTNANENNNHKGVETHQKINKLSHISPQNKKTHEHQSKCNSNVNNKNFMIKKINIKSVNNNNYANTNSNNTPTTACSEIQPNKIANNFNYLKENGNLNSIDNDIFLKKILSILNSLKCKYKKNIDSNNKNKYKIYNKEDNDEDSNVFEIIQEFNEENRNIMKELELKINKIILGCNYNTDKYQSVGVEYELNNIISLSKMRIDIYKKYFDFIYDLLTEIKKIAQNEINNKNNNLLQKDQDEIVLNPNNNCLNDSQLTQKTDEIIPNENSNDYFNHELSLNNSYSQFISSIGNDFYFDLINENNIENNNENNMVFGNLSFEFSSKVSNSYYDNFNSPKCINFKNSFNSPIKRNCNINYMNNKLNLLNSNKKINLENENILDATPIQFKPKDLNNYKKKINFCNNAEETPEIYNDKTLIINDDFNSIQNNFSNKERNNDDYNNAKNNNKIINNNLKKNFLNEENSIKNNGTQKIKIENLHKNINYVHPNQILNYINHQNYSSNVNKSNKIIKNKKSDFANNQVNNNINKIPSYKSTSRKLFIPNTNNIINNNQQQTNAGFIEENSNKENKNDNANNNNCVIF